MLAWEGGSGAGRPFTLSAPASPGRRLLREDAIVPPLLANSGSGGSVFAIRNAGYSHYNAFQVQFQRRMSHSLQALVSYSLAKSSDLGSTDQHGFTAQTDLAAASVSTVVLPPLTPSDYDIRNSIAGAISYEVPAPSWGRAGNAILRGWAVDGLVRVSSAPPINITNDSPSRVFGPHATQVDIVPGQPYWIADPTQPSGRALNPAAFTPPPVGVTGNFPRNGLRSPYSLNQTDLALRRRFSLTERVKLDVRAEYFNVFNHPMFGLPGKNEPNTFWGNQGGPAFSTFGKIDDGSTTNLAGGNANGQNALYAVGGPRSAQFTLKVIF
jgi:hypothetical protein